MCQPFILERWEAFHFDTKSMHFYFINYPVTQIFAVLRNSQFNFEMIQEQKNTLFQQRISLGSDLGKECNDESYDRMPVSDFGLSMLKSMGWAEGRGIGKNPQNALLKPIEYIPNHDRAGLGARKDIPSLKKRKMNEPEVDENGKVKHVVEIDGAKKSAKKIVEKHSRVMITEGKYKNLLGVVLHLDYSAKEVEIELDINHNSVIVHTTQVILEQDAVKISEPIDDASTKSESEDNNEKKKKKDISEKKKLKWMQPNIQLRVISKKIRNGKLYEKKVIVIDILDKYTFSVTDEDKNIIEELREKDVETCLPKIDGTVKVLRGEHAGELGTLISRDKQKNKILVKLIDTSEIVEYTQDDCATYVPRVQFF